ncbi:hypothetical protein [Leisingera sp. S232]
MPGRAIGFIAVTLGAGMARMVAPGRLDRFARPGGEALDLAETCLAT